ncbi:MAG: PAS domain-containing protein [Candidatus Dormibacteria bacterium]
MVARAKAAPNGHSLEKAPRRPAVLGPDLSEHELLRAVVAQSPVPLTVVDPAGIAMLWNPASEGVFGWSAQEVIGHRLPTLDRVSEVEHDEIRTPGLLM